MRSSRTRVCFRVCLLLRQAPRPRCRARVSSRFSSAVLPCAENTCGRILQRPLPTHPLVPCGCSRVAASGPVLSAVSPEGGTPTRSRLSHCVCGHGVAMWGPAPAEARPLPGGQAHVPAQAQKRRQLGGHPGTRGSPAWALAFGDLPWPVLTQSQKFCGLSKPCSNELFILSCRETAQWVHAQAVHSARGPGRDQQPLEWGLRGRACWEVGGLGPREGAV